MNKVISALGAARHDDIIAAVMRLQS